MAEVVHNAEQEFWRPPIAAPVREVATPMGEQACERCGTEFMVGARFCHSCGTSRAAQSGLVQSMVMTAILQNIREKLGLPMGSLVAFLVGLGCVFAALSVRIVYTPQRLVDWQAIQLYCIQWLLGAMAAFIAGILLRKLVKKFGEKALPRLSSPAEFPPSPTSTLVHAFHFSNRCCRRSPSFVHAIQVVDGAYAFTQGMSIRNRRLHVRLGEEHGLRQAATEREVTGHGRGEGTTGAWWVEFDFWRSDLKSSCSVPRRVVKLRRSIAFSRSPPVTTTAAAPCLCSACAAALICSWSVTAKPVRTAASSTFGVTTVHRGISLSFINCSPGVS